MKNKLLKANKGKKGSYTILVKKDSFISNRPLKEIIKEIFKRPKLKFRSRNTLK